MANMEKVILRRTFNIGDYQSLSVEAIGDGATLEEAHNVAARKLLMVAWQELSRMSAANAQMKQVMTANPQQPYDLDYMIRLELSMLPQPK